MEISSCEKYKYHFLIEDSIIFRNKRGKRRCDIIIITRSLCGLCIVYVDYASGSSHMVYTQMTNRCYLRIDIRVAPRKLSIVSTTVASLAGALKRYTHIAFKARARKEGTRGRRRVLEERKCAARGGERGENDRISFEGSNFSGPNAADALPVNPPTRGQADEDARGEQRPRAVRVTHSRDARICEISGLIIASGP